MAAHISCFRVSLRELNKFLFVLVIIYNWVYNHRWCRNCVELHLELFQSGMTRHGCPWEFQEAPSAVINLSRNKFCDDMKWIVSLKDISIWSRLADRCLKDFYHWLLLELNRSALEKLWFPSGKAISLTSLKPMFKLQSLHLAKLNFQLYSTLFS